MRIIKKRIHMYIIDTHTHIDGDEFKDDLPLTIARAKAAGVGKVFLPAIDLPSVKSVMSVCKAYPHYAYPMIGLHPEEVKANYQQVLDKMHDIMTENLKNAPEAERFIAIGEVGLDFYWTRENEKEQLQAFARQVEWSIETRLPLMIHCRKGQNEMLHILRPYAEELPGGVFHCFTGNQQEAAQLLAFPRFMLGIGGVLTFKSSHLREDLPAAVPLSRIVLETDSPYMAPVPHRGKRNESAFVALVRDKLAEVYGVSPDEVNEVTSQNAAKTFHITL